MEVKGWSGERRPSRMINVGGVPVGGDSPITVQSMTVTKTANVEGTLQQIYALAAAGCDIVRCTCNESEAAVGLGDALVVAGGEAGGAHVGGERDARDLDARDDEGGDGGGDHGEGHGVVCEEGSDAGREEAPPRRAAQPRGDAEGEERDQVRHEPGGLR